MRRERESPTTRDRVGSATLLLVTMVLFSRVLGFLRDAFIAASFGADARTDAFYAAFTLPDMLNYLVAGGTLAVTFIPIYARHLAASTPREGDRVLSAIATVMSVLLGAAIGLLEWKAPTLLGRYLHKLDPESLALAVRLTRILLPAQAFFYLGGLASATLMARHRFAAVSVAPLLYNAGTIAGGWLLGRRLGVAALAWGTLAGAILGPFLLQIIAAARAGTRYRPVFAPGHPDVRAWFVRSIPLMVGVSVVTADEWILRYFAAADPGAISCLSYARKLVMVPIALAGQAAGQASMPFLARLFAEGRRRELGELLERTVRASAVLASLAAGGLAALSVQAVDLLFRRGHFTAIDVIPTAAYVVVFSCAIPLWAIQGMLARAFYATGDTLSPMVAGTAVTVASLPLYATGFRVAGAMGLVVASDVAILLHTASLVWLLPRRVPECSRRRLLGALARVVGTCTVASALVRAVTSVFARGAGRSHAHDAFVLGSGGLLFALAVLALAYTLGIDDVRRPVRTALTRVRARL